MLPDDIEYLLFAQHARLLPQHLPVLEQGQRGHAPHLVFLGNRLVLVHIYFDDADFAAHFFGDLLDDGRLRFAGTAPFGMEVYKYGLVPVDELIEISFHDFDFAVRVLFFLIWCKLS